MTKEESYEQVQYGATIVPKGVTKIRSIFDFDNTENLFAFLHVCKVKKSTVEFENENLIYTGTEDDNFMDLRFTLYMCIKENPKLAEDYIRWLFTKEHWSKGEQR